MVPEEEDGGDGEDDIKALIGLFDRHRLSSSSSSSKGVQDDDLGCCPFCGGSPDGVTLADGNLTCTRCCTVIGRNLDSSAEWRNFSGCDFLGETVRCSLAGGDELLPSMVAGRLTSSSRSSGNTRTTAIIRRCEMWLSMSAHDRSLRKELETIVDVGFKHGVSKGMVDEARCLFKRATEQCLLRGANRRALAAACLFTVFKTNGVPRSVREISDMFGFGAARSPNDDDDCPRPKSLDAKALTRTVKIVQGLLPEKSASILKSSEPRDFVNRFCTHLTDDPALAACSHDVLARAMDLGLLEGFSPPSAAAGCIILVGETIMGIPVQRKDLSEVAQVSTVTMAKCVKHLQRHQRDLGV